MHKTLINGGPAWLFIVAALWGAAIFWLAPHPPMIDLPQHAAQVALLRDILQGTSPWTEFFRINWWTPYLIGYGLALPLSLVMPVAAALKLLLSLAYLAFVFMGVRLRRHFDAEPRLDWLFLLSFFGFAYTWGFFTFLVAAPIGLWFLLLADRYAHEQTPRRALGLTAVGLVLLASHGLVFLFAVGTGFLLVAANARSWRAFLPALWPYVIFGLASIAYFLISRHVSSGLALHQTLPQTLLWGTGPRIPDTLVYPLSANVQGLSVLLPLFTVLFMVAAPWLIGARIDFERRSSWLPHAVIVLIMLMVPSYAFNTQFLYQRFALFLLPTYAWAFTRQARPVSNDERRNVGLVMSLLIVLCFVMLSVYSFRTWRFGQESADIDHLTAMIEPGQRALTLAFDTDSAADNNDRIYAHYPAWYQAERRGLVDFNFAWFPPQIVRYRPDHLPKVRPGFEWHPERFDWHRHGGANYRYFFVRPASRSPQSLFANAPCMPQLLMSLDSWAVYENVSCPVP